MTGHVGTLDIPEFPSPWRRAEKPAGTAFGIGFLLAGLAGADGISSPLQLSPLVLSTILAALTAGLLCASAVYIVAVLYCFLRCGDASGQAEVKPASRACRQPRGEALISSLLFVALLAVLALHECVK